MRCYGPIYLSKYARSNDLLDKPRWKQLCCYVKNTKKIKRLLKASKDKQLRKTVKIKFSMKIPHYHKEAIMFDSDNDNTNWKDADLLKIKHIYNFDPFDSLRPITIARIIPGHTKIQVHIIYYYKQDGIYKTRMVDYGNVTLPKLDT